MYKNYTNNLGILFGVVFVMAIVFLIVDFVLIDALKLPVFREKFLSIVKRRKSDELMSDDITDAVLKRANYKCQSCGKEGKKIYHMDKEKSHNDPNNLLCLCDACLAKVQAGTISGEKLYFMRLGEKNAKQKRV